MICSIVLFGKYSAEGLRCFSFPRTPHDEAWMRILSAVIDPSITDAFRIMFPEPRFETYQFNAIHKTVLGLHSLTIEEVLGQFSSIIDAVDIDGRTALSWSSHKGDLRALECLLHNGANVNKADVFGNTSLSYAVRSGSRSCVQILLEHGASVDAANREGKNPLHRLAGQWDDMELLHLLVSYQADIDVTKTMASHL